MRHTPPTAVVLSHSSLTVEHRVCKFVRSLAEAGYRPVAAVRFPGGGDVLGSAVSVRVLGSSWTERLRKGPLSWSITYLYLTVRAIVETVGVRPRLVICVDRPMMPAALLSALLSRAALHYDIQELWFSFRGPSNWPRWLWSMFERVAADRALLITCTDHQRRQILGHALNLPASRIQVVPNVPLLASVPRSLPSLRTEIGATNGDFVICYAGSVSEGRALAETVQALHLLPPHFRLAIVGHPSGECVARLRKIATRWGVSRRFHLLPPVHPLDVPAYVRYTDCCLALYVPDSLNSASPSPSKLFDFAMSGIPTVASDGPFVREIVDDLNCGELISELTPTTIAAAILRVAARSTSSSWREQIRASVVARRLYWEAHQSTVMARYWPSP